MAETEERELCSSADNEDFFTYPFGHLRFAADTFLVLVPFTQVIVLDLAPNLVAAGTGVGVGVGAA